MAAYLSPARPRAAALPFAGPGSGLRGVGVPDKAALISAGAGLTRGRSAGRSHGAAGCTQAGASAGLLCCSGRGRETSCSDQLDQLGADPRLPWESRSGVPGSRGGGRNPKIGVRLSSLPGNRLSRQKPKSWKPREKKLD